MATWGKLKIKYNKHRPDDTLYYEYSTTCDQYLFRWTWKDDDWYGDHKIHTLERCEGPDSGEVQMEAYINHILAYNYNGDIEAFIERYIKNNRFADECNRIEVKE